MYLSSSVVPAVASGVLPAFKSRIKAPLLALHYALCVRSGYMNCSSFGCFSSDGALLATAIDEGVQAGGTMPV